MSATGCRAGARASRDVSPAFPRRGSRPDAALVQRAPRTGSFPGEIRLRGARAGARFQVRKGRRAPIRALRGDPFQPLPKPAELSSGLAPASALRQELTQGPELLQDVKARRVDGVGREDLVGGHGVPIEEQHTRARPRQEGGQPCPGASHDGAEQPSDRGGDRHGERAPKRHPQHAPRDRGTARPGGEPTEQG